MILEACAAVCTVCYVASTIGVLFQQRDQRRMTTELTEIIRGVLARQGLVPDPGQDEDEDEDYTVY